MLVWKVQKSPHTYFDIVMMLLNLLVLWKFWNRGYKKFRAQLNSAEHEIFSANKYKKIYLFAENFSCSAIFSMKEFANVCNLRFSSRTNFMLSWVEHEKQIYNLEPELMWK